MKTFNQFLEKKQNEGTEFRPIADHLEKALELIESLPEFQRDKLSHDVTELRRMVGNYRFLTGM